MSTLPPDRSLCPRCGKLVTYQGRGRRPIWCSSTCRVEASIERKGNRMAGVEPRVVTVVREVSVKPTIPPWRIPDKPRTSPEPARPTRDGGRQRRSATEWAETLESLRKALVSGAVYDRELHEVAVALNGVLDAFTRRAKRR